MGKLFRNAVHTFIMLLILVGSLPPQVTKAESLAQEAPPAAPSCFSLDVVFIIDQSSSMGGEYGLPPNDPTGQRANGPKWAIDWLTDNALDICPDAFHRVAVVSFGSSTQVDLPLSDINPGNTQEWAYLRTKLKENVQLFNLGQTDPKLAFEKAIQILDGAGQVGDTPRKRVIIYMTDGMPCVESLGCVRSNNLMDFVSYARDMRNEVNKSAPFDKTLLKQEQCLQQARETYGVNGIPSDISNKCLEDNRVSADTYSNSTYIWTLLLSFGQAWPAQLKDIYEEMSTSHGGKVIDITENRNDIPANFLDILTDLAGVPVTRLSCGNFAVNPLVRQARLTFFKLSEDTKVQLSYSDFQGKNHVIVSGEQPDGGFTVNEHYSEGANERYVLDYPYPGIWRIESDACEGIDAYYEPIQMDMAGGLNPLRIWNPQEGDMLPENSILPEYDQDPYFDNDSPFFLQYQMQDVESNIIDNPDGDFYGVKFDIKVIDPSGTIEQYEMRWDANEKKFFSTQPLKLPIPGEYKINLSGTVPHRNLPYGPVGGTAKSVFDQQTELFRHEGVTFQVSEVKPFRIEIVSPGNNELLKTIHNTILGGWPLTVNPIDVRVRIVRPDGEPIPPDDIAKMLKSPQDAFIAKAVQGERSSQSITLSPDPTAPGEYVGKVADFDAIGTQNLVAELQGETFEQFRPEDRVIEATFTREDTWLTRSQTYIYAFYLLILFFIVKIVIGIINGRNSVTGDLNFHTSDGQERIELRGKLLNKNRVSLGFFTKEFRNHPQWDVLRVLVHRLPSGANADGPNRSKIRVRMVLLSETKGLRRLFYKFLPNSLIRWQRDYELENEQAPETYSEYSTATIAYQN